MLDILKFQIKIVQAAVSVVKTAVNSIINVSYAVTTALTKPKPVITNQTRARASAVYGAVTTPLKRGEGPIYIEKATGSLGLKLAPRL